MILVTGAAGFIGFHVANALLSQGQEVVGIDNFDPFYELSLKKARLEILKKSNHFRFHEIDCTNVESMQDLWGRYGQFEQIVHLAAHGSVAYSIEKPFAYTKANIDGFLVILELARQCQHIVYASSSSVYGGNTNMPSSETDVINNPVSMYGVSKIANEAMAQAYHALYGMKLTGLRFFTVYGPWGRPDMAVFKFADSIVNDEPINIYNYGKMYRDFTYIDDIVDGVLRALNRPSSDGHKVYNLGSGKTIDLDYLVEVIGKCLKKEAKKNLLPLQLGDPIETRADISLVQKELGYQPKVYIEEGVERFVAWYDQFYGRVGSGA